MNAACAGASITQEQIACNKQTIKAQTRELGEVPLTVCVTCGGAAIMILTIEGGRYQWTPST